MKRITFEGTEEQIKNLKLLLEYEGNNLPKIITPTESSKKEFEVRVVLIDEVSYRDHIFLVEANSKAEAEAKVLGKSKYELTAEFEFEIECDKHPEYVEVSDKNKDKILTDMNRPTTKDDIVS